MNLYLMDERKKMDPETAIEMLQKIKAHLDFIGVYESQHGPREAIDIGIAAIEDKLGR